ncbi:MAG: ketoacyl-ACP synthase III [Planctomycetes bacterium]|nr:ketoacyl-ACP synthase III [Planctomycetota bacterium]
MPDSLLAAIAGFGSAVPDRVMTNGDFAKFLDTSDEWIAQRTGIRQRRILQDGQYCSTLATQAAKAALAAAGVEPSQIDLIICATVSGDMVFPSNACLVQKELGIKDIPAFDVAAACSGFLYGLAIGSQFIRTGTYRKVLVIGAEVLSRFADFTDRGSCILFGDAAGAVVLEPSDRTDKGVLCNILCADGGGWDYIYVPAGGSKLPATAQTVADRMHYIKMRGRDVYKFAVEKMQWLLGECMDRCGLKMRDISMVIPHQVNLRIIESAVNKFNFPMEKVFVNINKYGNTSAASIPLALDEAAQQGKIGPGSTIIMVAFGAGLTWAGSVVRL